MVTSQAVKTMANRALGWIAAAVGIAAAAPAAASTITYYHNDIAGSPVAATNSAGQVIWRESYRPYGERLTKSASAKSNDVWFTSRREDSSGLVYMGGRHYDPVAGRFVSTDPKGFDEANVMSFGRYIYANDNPYKYIDPNGRNAALAYAGGTLLLIGAAYYAISGPEQQARMTQSLSQFGNALSHLIFNEGSAEDKKPDLTDEKGRKHILEGDETGGGHRAGAGKPGKSEFPADWSDDKITGEISDVATDPDAARKQGRGGRTVVQGTRDGVEITVVVDSKGRIVTGYPTNTSKNPE